METDTRFPGAGGGDGQSDPPPGEPVPLPEKYQRLIKALHEACDRRGLSAQKRKEVAQEIVGKFWLQYGVDCKGFEWATLRGWVWTAVENELVDERRHGARMADLAPDDSNEALPATDNVRFDPQAMLEDAEVDELTALAINRMPERQRECFLMRRGGMSREEVATKLGIRPNTVSVNVTNALADIREALRDYDTSNTPRARRRQQRNRRTNE
jgi:RNA polymerase sigma factor (sigma-70 family)